ncbi:hypothetical protein PISMIDRAFT_687027, partial [Pisolithus microcarpus 441]
MHYVSFHCRQSTLSDACVSTYGPRRMNTPAVARVTGSSSKLLVAMLSEKASLASSARAHPLPLHPTKWSTGKLCSTRAHVHNSLLCSATSDAECAQSCNTLDTHPWRS